MCDSFFPPIPHAMLAFLFYYNFLPLYHASHCINLHKARWQDEHEQMVEIKYTTTENNNKIKYDWKQIVNMNIMNRTTLLLYASVCGTATIEPHWILYA